MRGEGKRNMKLVYVLAGLEVLTGFLVGLLLLLVAALSNDPLPLWQVVVMALVYWLGLREMLRHAWEMVRREAGREY